MNGITHLPNVGRIQKISLSKKLDNLVKDAINWGHYKTHYCL